MSFVFGVSSTSPNTVLEKLCKANLIKLPSEVAVHAVGEALPAKLKEKFLFLLTASDLTGNINMLMTSPYRDTRVFVFGSPMKLHIVAGVKPLDFEVNPEQPGFGFKLSSLSLTPVRKAKVQSALKRRTEKYLEHLLTHVQEGSLLNPLMTAIYSLPSTSQTKVKIVSVSWIYKSKTVAQLDEALDQLSSSGIKISAAFRTKLTDILTSDAAKKYQAAFSEYRKDKVHTAAPSIQKIARQFGTVEYEMTYILSVLRDAKSSRQFGDSFDKARNRKL